MPIFSYKIKQNYALRQRWFAQCQKPMAKLLIAILVTLSVPLPFIGNAYAADIPADQWVTITPKADPIIQGLSTVTIPNNASTVGMWSTLKDWPFVAIHAAILPNGRVLTYGSDKRSRVGVLLGDADSRWFDVWDPTIGFGTDSHNTNFRPQQQGTFCSTAAYLKSGELLITGGNGDLYSNDTAERTIVNRDAKGGLGSTIFTPSSNETRDDTGQLNDYRWYSTLINLPDGRPILMGGLDAIREDIADNPDLAVSQGVASMTPEIYENGAWTSLPGAYSRIAFGPDYLRTSYPRAWVAPNGKVFGISSDQMWYLDPNANSGLGSTVSAGQFDLPYSYNNNFYTVDPIPNVGPTSSAVMYDIGKILQVGGHGGYWGEGLVASTKATVVDINAVDGAPVKTPQQEMADPRRYANTLVLPNGKVLVSGGTTRGNNLPADLATDQQGAPDHTRAVKTLQIWSPGSNNLGSWSAVGPEAAVYRGYHSWTALLPNGTVLSGGGGVPGPVDNFNAEIYYPPYLFTNAGGLAVRPVISAISGLAYNNDAQIQLDVGANDTITDMAFIGLSTVTHSFNNGQRRIPVSFTRSGNRLTATVPNANLTPPGYYQVVVVNSNGVPSLGTIVAVGAGMTAPDGSTTAPGGNVKPTVSLTAPVANASYGKGANVSLTAYAADTDGAITKVEFYDGTKLIDTDTSDPYIATLTNATPGKHNLTAKAYDDANAVTSSSIVSINVSTKVNTPPKVKLTTPKNNANYVQGYVIPISATASDTGGSISKVEFYDGATLINTDTTKPYSYALPVDTATGQHSLTAKAYDNTDLVTTSNTITINVNANQAPIVTLTNLGISYVQGTKVTLKATAKDLDKGTKISRVEFYDDTTIIGTDTKAPYTAIFNTGILNTLGDHPITAKAYDNATPNAVSTSAIAVVKVTLPKPSIAKLCAKQNKICTIPEGTTATVWYGAKSSWYNKPNVTGQLTCDATSFDGEPITGNKTCVFVGN